jgi:DNA primase
MFKKIAMQCLFHKENTPSMMVNNFTRTFHCLSCGAAGKVVVEEDGKPEFVRGQNAS